MGIKSFIARLGTRSVIWSDNGTNFLGSGKELISCIENWNCNAPVLVAHKGLIWKFNPPIALHHWGNDFDLKTGGLVWMIEDYCPRGLYPLARIKSLSYGNDGIAWSTLIRSAKCEYARPIVKIALVLRARQTLRTFYNVNFFKIKFLVGFN